MIKFKILFVAPTIPENIYFSAQKRKAAAKLWKEEKQKSFEIVKY